MARLDRNRNAPRQRRKPIRDDFEAGAAQRATFGANAGSPDQIVAVSRGVQRRTRMPWRMVGEMQETIATTVTTIPGEVVLRRRRRP